MGKKKNESPSIAIDFDSLNRQFPEAGPLKRKNWMPEGFEGHVTRTAGYSWVVVKFPKNAHGNIIEIAMLPQEYFETVVRLHEKARQLQEEQDANSLLEANESKDDIKLSEAEGKIQDLQKEIENLNAKTHLTADDREFLKKLRNALSSGRDELFQCNCPELAQDGRHCERHQLAIRLDSLILREAGG